MRIPISSKLAVGVLSDIIEYIIRLEGVEEMRVKYFELILCDGIVVEDTFRFWYAEGRVWKSGVVEFKLLFFLVVDVPGGDIPP